MIPLMVVEIKFNMIHKNKNGDDSNSSPFKLSKLCILPNYLTWQWPLLNCQTR